MQNIEGMCITILFHGLQNVWYSKYILERALRGEGGCDWRGRWLLEVVGSKGGKDGQCHVREVMVKL